MIRRALVLISIAALYVAIKRAAEKNREQPVDHDSEAQWANEGGANAPATV